MIELPTESDPVRIVCGDCLDVLRQLPDDSFDAVVTSPPYNLGATPWPALGHWRPGHKCSGGEGKWKQGAASSARGVNYGAHGDSMPWGDYVAWQRAVISALWETLTPAGVIFYNHKPRVVGDRLWLPLELVPDHVVLRQLIVWDRGGGINYTSTALVPMCEWVMVLAKPGFRLKSKGASGLGDVWRIPPDADNEHPAPFPAELPRRCLDAIDGDLILDPFGGSGTTAVAALHEGRRCLLVEKDLKYCDIARRRVDEAMGVGRGSLFTQGDLYAEESTCEGSGG